MEECKPTNRQVWQCRAPLWELLALSFRYPARDLARAVVTGEWTDAAVEIAAANGIALPESFADDANAAKGAYSETYIHALRQEATRLFVGPGEAVVSPYEAVWRAKAEGVQPLLFVNPHAMAVERYCKACGLGSPEGKNDPLDHIATECELLEYLCLKADKAAEIQEANDGAGIYTEDAASSAVNVATNRDDFQPTGLKGAAEEPVAKAPVFPGGSPETAYYRFLSEHLSQWAKDFCAVLEHESHLPFYRAAAALLVAAIR